MGNRMNPLIVEQVSAFAKKKGETNALLESEVNERNRLNLPACSIGGLCFSGLFLVGFALADIFLYLGGIADLTGVLWAPLVSAIAGALLIGLDGE